MKKINIIFVTLLLFVGCAKIVAPVGGPKDIAPPIIVKSNPINGLTNYNSKSIKIFFNEYVTLNNPIENIIFSPPLTVPPTYNLQGKSLVIKFKESLLTNTTYNIIFADAIKDFTEGNILPLYQYSFSTGNIIDTFKLEGILLNSSTTLPEKGVFVFLYHENIDSLPLSSRPTYLTKTKQDGTFQFQNIKQGSYKIFALKDINSNLIYDLPNEEIAFSDNLVHTDSITLYELAFFKEEDQVQQILNPINPQKGCYKIPLKKPNSGKKSAKTSILYPPNINFYLDVNHTFDTLSYYFYDDFEDSVVLQLEIQEWGIIDTLTFMPYKSNKLPRNKNLVNSKLNINVAHAGELYEKLTLHFSYPIKPNSNIETIIIKELNNSIDTTIERFSLQGSFLNSFRIPYSFEPKASYTLLFKDSLFFGQNGFTNDTLIVKFTTKTERDYGSLSMFYEISEDTMNYLILLLDGNNRIIQKNTISNSQKILYEHLIPGNYKVKIIFDNNSNGKWDTGNYLQNIQPEKIIYFEKPISIRGFWDLEETFKIN